MSFKEIEDNLEAVSAIKTIATTYQEISQKEMSNIREKALKNRKFISKLAGIYTTTKEAHLKKDDREEVIKKEKEEVVVFLSANARFYGALLWDVWAEAKKYLQKTNSDLVVIAENGRFFAQNSDGVDDFTYFDLKDEEPDEEQVKKIVEFIKKYKKINVFHGEFENILKQSSAKTVIPGKLPEDIDEEDSEGFLFEPSTKEILEVFETELLTAFFNQTFLEHRLARHATRVVAMHQAGENAEERQEKLKMKLIRLKRKELDKKQFEITGPLQLWD